MDREITFEKLPEAVAYLIDEVAKLRRLLEEKPFNGSAPREPIDIDEASKLIMKAKPTIYAMVQKGKIPCYKSGQKLYFYKDELLEWISKGRKLNMEETKAKIEEEMNSTVRNRPKKRFL